MRMHQIILPSLALLAGCNGGDFPPVSLVHSLSVLAVVAEPPEVAMAGGDVALRAEVYDPMARPVAVKWSLCTLAPDARNPGLNPDCVVEAPGGADLLALGDGASLAATLPAPRIAGLVPDGTGGIYVPVRADVTAGEDHIVAIYRLRVHLFGPPNHNPQLVTVTSDGSFQPGVPIELRPALAPPGVGESYVTFDIGTQMPKTVTETITYSWLATAGTFHDQRTDDSDETTDVPGPQNTWTVDANQPPGPVHLWVVARDERGGTALLSTVEEVR